MKTPLIIIIFVSLCLLLSECTNNRVQVGKGIHFKIISINPESEYEAACFLDMNNDGKLDIFCGSFCYKAPEWEKQFVREQDKIEEYYNDFANLPLDVNEDGFQDIVNAAWFSKTLFWIKNPGDSTEPFKLYAIDQPGNMETALMYDMDNDGRMDILPNVSDKPAWYSYKANPAAKSGAIWTKHELPVEAAGHGIGAGDINSDGIPDIVVRYGWLEQTSGNWNWHPDFDLGDRPSIPILIHDIDSDGDADILWGVAHGYGLFWLEQSEKGNNRMWEKHSIDDSWSQAHYLILADLDGQGHLELVTGKRYRAHNGKDPGGNDSLCVYYYQFNTTLVN